MKILKVKTEHTTPFKILIEVLKEILQETNIEFHTDTVSLKNKETEEQDDDENEEQDEDEDEVVLTEEDDQVDDQVDEEVDYEEIEDEDDEDDEEDENQDQDQDQDKEEVVNSGMRIMAVDTTKTVLINLKLDAKNFTTFECKKKKLVLGVNLIYFHKLIKAMEKDDSLTLYVDHDDKNYLKIKIDNPDAGQDTVFKLKLMDLGNHKMKIPDITFDAKIIMNSQKFHKICREMNTIAEFVEIKCLKNKVVFTCKGDCAERTTTYRSGDDEDGNGITIRHTVDKDKNSKTPLIIQGVYELKNLVLFSKCASLCNDIEIYMKNNYPLVIKYTVATLGRILLCLTPINDTGANNQYSDEDALYSDEDVNLII